MDYYQELGVQQDASVQEIRRAYKIAARLLHPDNQPDQDLRRMAEIQMRRLNEVLEILSDPATRREYDRTLTANRIRIVAIPPPPQLSRHRFAFQHWYWAALGLLAFSISVWWIHQPEPSANGTVQENAESGEPATAPKEKPNTLQKRARRLINRHTNRQTKPISRQEVTGEGEASPVLETSPREEATTSPPPVQSSHTSGSSSFSPESKPLSREASLEGSWVFASAVPDNSDDGSYPPVFIEFRLGRDKGLLSGSYKGRYKVTNPSISSEIRLRMEEKSHTARSARMAWTSQYGATGEAELVLTSEDRMTVAWWTTGFGGRNALTSGTAILTRWETRR